MRFPFILIIILGKRFFGKGEVKRKKYLAVKCGQETRVALTDTPFCRK